MKYPKVNQFKYSPNEWPNICYIIYDSPLVQFYSVSYESICLVRVEYEDYHGRSRKCLKKDLPEMLKQNKELAEMSQQSSRRKLADSLDELAKASSEKPENQFNFGPVPYVCLSSIFSVLFELNWF